MYLRRDMWMLNEKNIFLIDGIGALCTAILVGVVLPVFYQYIGMPIKVLYFLSFCALAYAIYSLSCFLFVNHSKPIFLQIITWANLFYCALTILCMGFYFDKLTFLGFCYFLVEIAVISGLVLVEKKILRTKLL